MTKPDTFMLTTDYATLKNSESGLTAQVTVPGSIVIGGAAVYAPFFDIPIKEAMAISTGRISSSKNSNRSLIGNATDSMRFGVVTGIPGALYDVYAFLWRVSPNVVRFQALIQNPYSDPLTTEAGDETFTVVFNTFVPPF